MLIELEGMRLRFESILLSRAVADSPKRLAFRNSVRTRCGCAPFRREEDTYDLWKSWFGRSHGSKVRAHLACRSFSRQAWELSLTLRLCYVRKFFRHCLPRLKYHNPAIPMTVDWTVDRDGPACLTIFFAPPTVNAQGPAPTQSSSPDKIASNHQPFDRTHLIEMKHRHRDEILHELLEVTQGRVVSPSEEERTELDEMDQQNRRSDHDREVQKSVLLKRRREREMLEQARKSVEVRAS